MKREQLNIGIVRLADGTIDGGVYEFPHKHFFRSFCDEHESALTGDEVLWAIPLMVSGRNYAEKQEYLRGLAIDAMNAASEYGGFSYGELADIQEFFSIAGARFGLLQEFRENAVC